MPKSSRSESGYIASEVKAPVHAMTDDRKREIVAQLTDDVLGKLAGAFFDVCKFEHWTKRDLATISGINETAINHILAGRRKNLTIETIALLARAMGTRPELVLHDTRPVGNQVPASSASSALTFYLPASMPALANTASSVASKNAAATSATSMEIPPKGMVAAT
jgi:transcriptional regulator with XRE-family HTH domain